MIDTIECISLDFRNLKTQKEIETYIPTQLIKYFPDPELLTWDYIESGLVCYTLKDNLTNLETQGISHPLLLFKYLLKKDGCYLVIYSNRVLEVTIINKIITNTKHIFLNEFDLKDIPTKAILISDQLNSHQVKKYYNGKILLLEDLYKRCKKDLFKPKKRKLLPPILLTLGLICLTGFILYLSHNFNESTKDLKNIENKYNNLLLSNNKSSKIENEYNALLEETKIIESQIPPNLYSIFYTMEEKSQDFKVYDLNYNNRFLIINAISKNSIKLISNLNNSDQFSFIQNSTTTKDNFELVNFSGEILCP